MIGDGDWILVVIGVGYLVVKVLLVVKTRDAWESI